MVDTEETKSGCHLSVDMNPILYVKSGVPQGTVLGSLMFLIHANDIRSGVSFNLRLFADDCILYRVIDYDHDHNSLQSNDSNLDLIVKWTQLWKIFLNIRNCISYMRVVENRHCFPLIMNQPLQHVTEHSNLGVVNPSLSILTM